jgi:hypothetical protein
MRLVLLAAATLAVMGATSLPARAIEDSPILPGFWESTSKVSFPLPSTKTDRKCITADQVIAFLSGPSNSHYTCKYDKTRFIDGQAEMEGECVDSGVRARIRVNGAYTSTSFQLTSHLQANLGGLQIPIEASIDAHRLSEECPVGAKADGPERKKRDE